MAARKRITKLDHILPCGALRHCVMGDAKSTNISKKRNFHQVIISPSGLYPFDYDFFVLALLVLFELQNRDRSLRTTG